MAGYSQRICKNTVAVLIIFAEVYCWIYDGANKGFIAIPDDIGNRNEKIYLEKNSISHIHDDSSYFRKVYHLELSENKIDSLSERAFAGFQRLKFLNLKNNEIKKVIFKVEDIPQLEVLSIENNQLTQLPTFCGVFKSFEEVYYVWKFHISCW